MPASAEGTLLKLTFSWVLIFVSGLSQNGFYLIGYLFLILKSIALFCINHFKSILPEGYLRLTDLTWEQVKSKYFSNYLLYLMSETLVSSPQGIELFTEGYSYHKKRHA